MGSAIVSSKSLNVFPLWTWVIPHHQCLEKVSHPNVWPPPPRRYRMSGMRSYKPEQIMLSAVVRRSSRDLSVMKEKLILSGETLGLRQHTVKICSLFLLSVVWAPELPNSYLIALSQNVSPTYSKYEELAILSFRCPACMSLHPQHASVCLWMFLLLPFLSSMLKVSPSSSLWCAPPVWPLPLFHASITSLITRHFSAHYAPLHPSIIHLMHQTSPPVHPLETMSCVWELIESRQPLVLGVKGKPPRCDPSSFSHFFSFSFPLSDSLIVSGHHHFDQSGVSSCESAMPSHTLTFLSFFDLQRWGMELAVLRSCTKTTLTITTAIRAWASDWGSALQVIPVSVSLFCSGLLIHWRRKQPPSCFLYIL